MKKVLNHIKNLILKIADDNVAIYASQASFFVIISVVPSISVIVSIISFFIPTDISGLIDGLVMPDGIEQVIGTILSDLQRAPKISLLSVSAVTTLWTAARGMSSIRTGIQRVYCARGERSAWYTLGALAETLLFMLLMVAAVILLLFGESIARLLPINRIGEILMYLRTPLFALFMCILFTAMYAVVARRSTCVRHGILPHLPGGAFASVGWILFSYIYSKYIQFFPSASYIYGGLAAICLIMLWLYICMTILLIGAEINKLYFARVKE